MILTSVSSILILVVFHFNNSDSVSIDKRNICGGASGVMVIVAGIGHSDTIAFHIALIPLGKVWI